MKVEFILLLVLIDCSLWRNLRNRWSTYLALQIFPSAVLAFVIIGFLPMVPVTSINRLVILSKWERSNNLTLYYTKGVHGKIFPYPYMFDGKNPSTQNKDCQNNDNAFS